MSSAGLATPDFQPAAEEELRQAEGGKQERRGPERPMREAGDSSEGEEVDEEERQREGRGDRQEGEGAEVGAEERHQCE